MGDNHVSRSNEQKQSMRKFSDSITELTDSLLSLLEMVDNHSLNNIKPYLLPRKNISALIEFFDNFQKASREYKNLRTVFGENKILEKSSLETVEILELEENNILRQYKPLKENAEKLEKFKDIKIVAKFLRESNEFSDEILAVIEKSVLDSLTRLPKVVDNLDVYTKFVIDNKADENFVKKYTNIILERLGFAGIENNQAAILQRTKNLSGHFKMITDFNRKILGSKKARAVNDGLIKLMVLDLKRIFVDELEKIRIEKNPESIPFMIQLYARLRHSGDVLIKEIEDLFIFKDEILTLIFNCFIELFIKLDLLKEPNRGLRSENIVNLFTSILDQFDNTKEVKRSWVDRYGSSFGVYSLEELNKNFVEKLYLKITKISEILEIEESSIYIINNISKFKRCVHKIDKREIKDIIYKNCETIVGIWKIAHSSLSGSTLYNSLMKSIEQSKKYYLPDEERLYISDKIKELVQSLIANNDLKGNKELLLNEIRFIYGATE